MAMTPLDGRQKKLTLNTAFQLISFFSRPLLISVSDNIWSNTLKLTQTLKHSVNSITFTADEQSAYRACCLFYVLASCSLSCEESFPLTRQMEKKAKIFNLSPLLHTKIGQNACATFSRFPKLRSLETFWFACDNIFCAVFICYSFVQSFALSFYMLAINGRTTTNHDENSLTCIRSGEQFEEHKRNFIQAKIVYVHWIFVIFFGFFFLPSHPKQGAFTFTSLIPFDIFMWYFSFG